MHRRPYLYRYKRAYGYPKKPSVLCDGREVARVLNGRFVKIEIEPGKHVITSTYRGNGIDLALEGGQTYYVRMDWSPPTFWHSAQGWLVTLVPKEQATYELSQLEPLDSPI